MIYKRSSALVAVWEEGVLTLRNYAQRTTAPATPQAIQILQALSSWRTLEQLATECAPLERIVIETTLSELVAAGIVERPVGPIPALERGLHGWADWSTS